MKKNNILETIGDTPIVRINKLAPAHVNLFVKLEAFNPGGSVKDRLALAVIEDAEASGALLPGQTVVEATSGNTGIGLAMVCAQKGYPLVIVMAESFSVERRKLMRFLGAKVVLTPAAMKGSGMLAKAAELAQEHGWFLTRQFDNEANAAMHERTTAVEILNDFEGEKLDYWVTGFGTGGTLNGVSRMLKKRSPETKIVCCEPDNSQLLGSGVDQESSAGATVSHPAFRPHAMQGWTPDFISSLVEQVVDRSQIDILMPVAGEKAIHYSRQLALQEGIFTGITAGATLAGALTIAEKAEPGSNILCMLPDTGERYMSTPLFDGIDTEMDDAELEIAASTPNYRFDVTPSPPANSNASAEPAPKEGVQAMESFINDPDQPIVVFALEWCEFCWAEKKLLQALDIPFVAVDLDSLAYQQDDAGGKIRKALLEKIGSPTIPQTFIAGELLGGCSEVLEAHDDGSLRQLLDKYGIHYKQDIQLKATDFLPSWVAK